MQVKWITYGEYSHSTSVLTDYIYTGGSQPFPELRPHSPLVINSWAARL
jgi:hypothetical protein